MFKTYVCIDLDVNVDVLQVLIYSIEERRGNKKKIKPSEFTIMVLEQSMGPGTKELVTSYKIIIVT